MTQRRRVVHVVYSFEHGGLENVIVQLINRLPADRFEHVLLSLTTIGAFRDRIERDDVQFIELNKPPGHAVPLYPRIWRLLRELRADVLHTCNLAALEVVPLGWLARVPLRIHAEHGWDAHDPRGESLKYQRLRRLYKPFVSHYVAVSKDIDDYLRDKVGVPASRRSLILNGVDTDIFTPASGVPNAVAGCPFKPGIHRLIATVGRLQTVKNQPLLARAFVHLLREYPQAKERLRLVLVGEGPLRAAIDRVLAKGDAQALCWMPGSRDDIADILRMVDVFVLPSDAEGTSCTLQEAMATGLATVATAVGGSPDLIQDGVSGRLVPAGDEVALAQAIWSSLQDHETSLAHGRAARAAALARFALNTTIAEYQALMSGAFEVKNLRCSQTTPS